MKVIFHIDVNSAFLSWSAVKRLREDPHATDLRTIPSAVGGDVSKRHGVITARSIPAKKYGVKTGEPVITALRKCPNLVLVSSDFDTYRKYSAAFISILREYTDKIQQASIDEAFMDVTELLASQYGEAGVGFSGEAASGETAFNGSTGLSGEAVDVSLLRSAAASLADKIRSDVSTRLGFTVNVGISENKLLAKMASDFTKPDRTHTLWPEEVPAKMWPLPIGDLYGCGSKTAEKLGRIGIRTIGDAAKTDPKVLKKLLGEKGGMYIHYASCGVGSDILETEPRDAKSYSNETTTSYDITRENYNDEMPRILRHLSEKVAARMKRDGAAGKTISVSVKTSDFERRSRQTTIPVATNDAGAILGTAAALMKELSFGTAAASGTSAAGSAGTNPNNLKPNAGLLSTVSGYRLIGVGVSNLEGEASQISMSDFMTRQDEEEQQTLAAEKHQTLENLMASIRERYGENAAKWGGK